MRVLQASGHDILINQSRHNLVICVFPFNFNISLIYIADSLIRVQRGCTTRAPTKLFLTRIFSAYGTGSDHP